MQLQRMILPESRIRAWTVLDDSGQIIEPIAQYIQQLHQQGRASRSRRAATRLKLFWEYLGEQQQAWDTVEAATLAGFAVWLDPTGQKPRRIPPILTTVEELYDYHWRAGRVAAPIQAPPPDGHPQPAPSAAVQARTAREHQLVTQLVSPAHEDQLVLALARGRGHRGVNATVTAAAIQAARLIRLNATFLDLAVKGALALDVDETGDLIFISLDTLADPADPATIPPVLERGGRHRAKEPRSR